MHRDIFSHKCLEEKKRIFKNKDESNCAEEKQKDDVKKLVEGKKLEHTLRVSIDFDKLKSMPDELINQRLILLEGIELPPGPPPEQKKPVTRHQLPIMPAPPYIHKPSPMPRSLKLNSGKIQLEAIIKLMQSLTQDQWQYAVAQSQTIEIVDDSAKEEYLEKPTLVLPNDKSVKEEGCGKNEIIEIVDDSVEDLENNGYKTMVNQILRGLAELCHKSYHINESTTPRNAKDVKKEDSPENILSSQDIEHICNTIKIPTDVNLQPANFVRRTPENHDAVTNTIDQFQACDYATDGNHELSVENTQRIHSAAEMLLSLSGGYHSPLDLHHETESTRTVSLSTQCNHREIYPAFAVTHNARENDLSDHMNALNVRNSYTRPFLEKGTPDPKVLSPPEGNFAPNALSFGGPMMSLQSTAPLALLPNSTPFVNRPRAENIIPKPSTVLWPRPIFQMEHSKSTPSATLRLVRPAKPTTILPDIEHSNFSRSPGADKTPARILKRRMTCQTFEHSDPSKRAKIVNHRISQKEKATNRIFGSNITVKQNVMPPPPIPPQLPAASAPPVRSHSTLEFVSRPGLFSTPFGNVHPAPTTGRISVLPVQHQSNALYNSTIQLPSFSYFQPKRPGQGFYQSQNLLRLPAPAPTDHQRVNNDFQHPLPHMCVPPPPPPSWTPAPTQVPAYQPYLVPPMDTQGTIQTPQLQRFEVPPSMHNGPLQMHSQKYYTPHKH